MCMICNKAGQGPVLKCENPKCSCQFHVECARINKYHLECFLTEEGFKYYIYCHTHRPLEFLKNLEFKNQKKIEDILKFAELIEKYFEASNKSNNNNKMTCFTKTFSLSKSTPMYLKFLNKKRGKLNGKGDKQEKNEKNEQVVEKLNKQQIDKILTKVREIYNKLVNLDVSIKYREKSNKYEIIKDNTLVNHNYNFKSTFDKNIFPWHLINIPGIPIKTAYINYGQIINCETEFKKYILLKNDVIPKIEAAPVLPAIEDDKQYCYCKSNNTENSYMIACSNDDCEYNGWFHPSCCPETFGKSKEEIESDNFEFTCFSCRTKIENLNQQNDTDTYNSNNIIKDNKQIIENKDSDIIDKNENVNILTFSNSTNSNVNSNSLIKSKSRGTTLEDCTWTENNNSHDVNLFNQRQNSYENDKDRCDLSLIEKESLNNSYKIMDSSMENIDLNYHIQHHNQIQNEINNNSASKTRSNNILEIPYSQSLSKSKVKKTDIVNSDNQLHLNLQNELSNISINLDSNLELREN